MLILTQFILRLSFGMALGMAGTDPRLVTSGYYRNHLYVLLGLNVLATMAALGDRGQLVLAPPLAAAILCYVGAALWLYEKPRPGIICLAIISGISLAGAWADTSWPSNSQPMATWIAALDPLSGGLVLGLTLAAMFLGHWYLNSPTMALGPLRRLIALMAIAIGVRAMVEAAWLVLVVQGPPLALDAWAFIALRWLAGIVGALVVALMAWQTLKIPNTQSATGILYVGVIVTFLGELTSLLLATQIQTPL
ncbi:MAG TPA: hypothetical protein VHV08_07930 [Pirellulales bacterium]|nr:hypothetical protein [Pirellulales bacterium]